jgi:hypothetical protein
MGTYAAIDPDEDGGAGEGGDGEEEEAAVRWRAFRRSTRVVARVVLPEPGMPPIAITVEGC